MSVGITRRATLCGLAAFATMATGGCAVIRRDQIGDGRLQGRVVVEWYREDQFIYRRLGPDALSFLPSFASDPTDVIIPGDMFTDGGSVPRIFWGIPGLSPWGLAPAYIIHDWLFEVRRCRKPGWDKYTFEQSALILAEVGKALIDHGLIKHDMLDAIIWGVSTRYARDLWDTPRPCVSPPPRRSRALAAGPGSTVVDFRIPPRRAQR